MRGSVQVKIGTGLVTAFLGMAFVMSTIPSCGGAPTPFVVRGPGTFGNEAPTLNFLEPISDITRSQGDSFLIRWTDTDRDDNATINFSLVSLTNNSVIMLASGINENDAIGQDQVTINTTLIPQGTYNILGIIDDRINPPTEVFASITGGTDQRVVITIVGPGEGPQTVPPTIAVTEPAFNRSVAQDDILTVTVQPSLLFPNALIPFDPDSIVRLFILLDVDRDPLNDDPANPDPTEIILLRERNVQPGDFDSITFEIEIDLAQIPSRPTGEPYFIRATVNDGTNPPVHQYAVGTINVVQLASSELDQDGKVVEVDLFEIGRTKSGAKFQGFDPMANLGSRISGVSDFDNDGVDDFVMVAQFGNPQNVGPVGQAYLLYGQGRTSDVGIPLSGDRFGGTLSVNSISVTISGAIFNAPPVRTTAIPDAAARTDGITDVSFISDLNFDGKPELLFGLPHVHGAIEGADYDPTDSDDDGFFCYPDPFVNNLSNDIDPDLYFYAGGMAVIVNSTNRDNDGLNFNSLRLDSTSVDLELSGVQARVILDASGMSVAGSILARADTNGPNVDLGTGPLADPAEPLRVAGARVIAGGYDWVTQFESTREGLFGSSVRSMGDLNNDGFDEIIISSPRNERYLNDLQLDSLFSTHLFSTLFIGSITVLPGTNYNLPFWRERSGEEGTSTIPSPRNEFGSCGGNPDPRALFIPADSFEIFAEDIDDMLGEGQSAGDFNQDGLDDILCGAPLNNHDLDGTTDTGATYIIYGKPIFGEVNLQNASSPLRVPMLRIRGVTPNDQIGWRQTSGFDVNGDRIDDVFIGSPHTDFGDVVRTTCLVDVNRDGFFDQADVTNRAFNRCMATDGDEIFTNTACDAFDYDNDGDIDEDDRCVFCCLSDDCVPNDDCTVGTTAGDCCANMTDNGFVGIIFGGVTINGDRDISQLATTQLPGTRFFGTHALDRAGADISSAGDFNQDGFGDILIAVPGETRVDSAGRIRVGVVYLVFGGTHLTNTTWSLSEVGSQALPGIVFISPYVMGRPNEAAPLTVANIGDINNDGFGDIAIGNPMADFIDQSFPQGPDAPGDDPATGRRRNVGDVYIIYGNNFGSNRSLP